MSVCVCFLLFFNVCVGAGHFAYICVFVCVSVYVCTLPYIFVFEYVYTCVCMFVLWPTSVCVCV